MPEPGNEEELSDLPYDPTDEAIGVGDQTDAVSEGGLQSEVSEDSTLDLVGEEKEKEATPEEGAGKEAEPEDVSTDDLVVLVYILLEDEYRSVLNKGDRAKGKVLSSVAKLMPEYDLSIPPITDIDVLMKKLKKQCCNRLNFLCLYQVRIFWNGSLYTSMGH